MAIEVFIMAALRLCFHTSPKMKFSINDFFTADLVRFTADILNGKLNFLCSVIYSMIIDRSFIKQVSSFSGNSETKK